MNTKFKSWTSFIGATFLLSAPLLAADLVWIGGTGNWNAAGNWSPAQVPTAADNAWITNSGTYTVTVPAGTTATNNSLTLGGASGGQTLAVDRATLSVNGASVINPNGQLNFLVAQSVVTGPGNITVNGSLNWPNGTMSGSGVTTIGSGGTLIIGSGGVTLSRSLNNGGTGSWSGGNFTISAGNSFNNLAGGTFDITADGRLSGASTTPINNSGLVRLTAGTTGTIITAPFNNSGNLHVLASILNLNLGGTHSGIISNAAGATLNFGGGNHVLTATSLVTGAGTLGMNGTTTLSASGTLDLGTTLSVSAGVASLSSGCNVTGSTLSIGGSGGVINYNSAGPVFAINLNAGTLGGTSPIIVAGPLSLSGGSVTNPLVTASGGLSIGGNVTLNATKLINPATAVWSAGNLTGANGAAISNLLGATFINSFDGNALTGAGATPLFINAGTFQKTNGTAVAGATAMNFQFLNTGTVEVQTNTLRYAINQQTAGLTLLDGGELSVQAQPLQLLGGSLMGTGLVTVANTANIVNSSSVSPGLPIGELDIAGNYQQTSSGALNIDLGGYAPATGSDLLTVTAGGGGGVATLGGTLNVSLANGFSPTNGATFTFLTASSRVGAFSVFNYPSNDIGMLLNYDATSAKVTVSNLKPAVANPITNPPAVTYGQSFNYQFPVSTFIDPDGDALTYTASGMPAGIVFSGATRTFSGTPLSAGVFPVIVSAKDSGTPSLTATNIFIISVNPAPLTITAQPQTKAYGSADPALTYTVTGLQLGDAAVTVLSGALTRSSGESVTGGPYPITQGTLSANGNYVINFTGSSLTISPAPLSITADAQAKVYGAADPAFTASYAGFVNGESPAVLTGTLSLVRAPGQNVGSYAITPSGLTSPNYSITFNPGTLTITRAALSVIADNKNKIYGSADPAFTASFSGFVNGDTQTALGGALILTRSPGENVGSYLITPSGLTSPNYTIAFNTGTLAISKAALSVAADPKSKTYGTADPAFTANYSGFLNGDTQASLGGTLGFTRAPGENVGGYLITPNGLTSSNYTIAFNTGTLTISPAPLTVTAGNKNKVYGTADPAFSVSYAGFVNGDTATVVGGTLSFARAPGENVGNYPITPAGLAAANYSITFVNGTLSVTPAALTVTADNKVKTYGAVDPGFTVSYAGFVNGDAAGSLTGSLSVTRAAGENVGSYLITPSGLSSGNYNISFSTGTLTILRAPLSVTADNKNKNYGSIDPVFTAGFSGFVNGETPAVLGGALSFVRAAGENAGSYLITPAGLTSSNYTITFNTGTLTINKAALTVTADAKSKTYGAGDPTFTVTYAGFVNGETPAVLAGSLILTRSPGENVGAYPITPSGLTSSNYAINFTGSTLAITPAALTVTAQSKAKTYGAVDPALTFTVTGFQFTDTQASVLTGALTRVAGENVAGSPYAINQGSLAANANYTINFTGSTLAITPASLAVTAQSKAKTYGAVDPVLTFTVSGFQFADTQASVLSGALTRAAGESVAGSPYAINQGSLAANANYTISFTGSTLAISPAALTVTADNKNKTYGAADPVFTASYSGFVNGESSTVLNGAVTFTRAPGQNVGSYGITPAGVTASNYAITFSAGTLTITKAPLTVTADNKIKTFGAADPVFTATEAGFVNGETSAVLGGSLVFTRTPGEGVGSYPISPSGLTSDNYAITFNDGTLTIVAPAPTIRSLTQTAPGIIQLTWSSISNASYRVQFVSTVNSTNWIDLPGDVLATGNTASKSDPVTPTNRFYRIRLLP